MGVITFNGVPSTDANIEVEHQPDYPIAERDFELVHVPGRNGDFLIDSGSYKNVNLEYDIAFIDKDLDFFQGAHKVSKWLHSAPGYARLEDTYDPLYYRLALYKENLRITDILGKAGRATITFNAKPQRFLKSGDTAVTVASGSSITNLLDKPSRPIITVRGSGDGELDIGDQHFTFTGISGYITVDSEVEDCYKNYVTVSNAVEMSSGYPVLKVGSTGVTFSGGITSVEIVPKWWTL